MVVATAVCLVLAYLSQREHRTSGYAVNILGVLQTNVGTLAQGAYTTLASFCAKFAVASLFMKKECILLTFAPVYADYEAVMAPVKEPLKE